MRIRKCRICGNTSPNRWAIHSAYPEHAVCSFCLLRLIKGWNESAEDFPIAVLNAAKTGYEVFK